MQVRDGMSEVVLTVGPSHTLREAAAMMVEKGIGAALVTDDERPVPCIVTERDILNSLGHGEDPDEELVSEHMSEGVVAVTMGSLGSCPSATSCECGLPPVRRRG